MSTPNVTLYPGILPAKGQANDSFDTNVDDFLNWLTLTNGPQLNVFINYLNSGIVPILPLADVTITSGSISNTSISMSEAITAPNGTTPTFRMGTPTTFRTAGSGTYTVPVGAVALRVRMCGGGGGGGGASSVTTTARASAGGTSGTDVDFLITTLASSYPYAVGAGGIGSTGAIDGSNGGGTTFGTATAPNGIGGANSGTSTATEVIYNTSAGPISATVPDYTVIFGVPRQLGSTGLKFTASSRIAGSGGDSQFGPGGYATGSSNSATAAAGNNAAGNGAGGGGCLSSTTTTQTGGNGTPGILIITPLY